MRGGTSRGGFFLREDLPDEPVLRDAVVLSIYGSPDLRQIDGIGGGDALTSKIAVVAASTRAEADVDYTFGQVGIDTASVFWVGNCGNMSSAVGPFAVSRGLVQAVKPITRVRIFNTNTNKVLTAEVQVDDNGVVEEGNARIAGVPGTGAPIMLDFGNCGGAVTGKLLPTGAPSETISMSDGHEVTLSIVDAATPFVFVSADDVGMIGTELPPEIDTNPRLLSRLEEIRAYAARTLGLIAEGQIAREVSPSIPRVSVVSPPCDFTAADGSAVMACELDIVGRQMSMQRTHKTYAVTGTLCTAVAAAIPGTVVARVARVDGGPRPFTIGHPGGIISARVSVDGFTVHEASILRTARVIMDGYVHVPNSVWPARE